MPHNNRLKLTTAIEECTKANMNANMTHFDDGDLAIRWAMKAAEIISSGPYSISESERALLLLVLERRNN